MKKVDEKAGDAVILKTSLVCAVSLRADEP